MKSVRKLTAIAAIISVNALNCHAADSLVAGNTAFALALYENLSASEGNLFFSPYSISAALAMTCFGARGDTAKQMAGVLHFPEQRLELLEGFSRLDSGLAGIQEKGNVELNTANALWVERTHPFLDSFTGPIRDTIRAELRQADFINEYEKQRIEINAWVEKQTREKIADLVQPGMLNSLTMLVLVNAIYFMGDWAQPFDTDATEDAPFHTGPDSKVVVPMMSARYTMKYAEDDDLQVVELPYAGDDLSMIVMLPKRVDGLSAIEASLNTGTLDARLSGLTEREVILHLPRFKISSEFDLAETLAAMGMTDAFSAGRADFSGMDGTRELFISAVIHKALVDVNEQGTEAAAATAVIMMRTAFDPRPVPVFRADRPFLFFIRENRSGSILFFGRMADPSEK